MGQPYEATPHNFPFKRRREQTLGSETSQYQEEKRTIVIPLVAASETGGAQTQPHYRHAIRRGSIVRMGVIRLQRWQHVELQNADVVERAGKLDSKG